MKQGWKRLQENLVRRKLSLFLFNHEIAFSMTSFVLQLLTETSCIPGRKEIIAEFKALVSSFPNEMGSMQDHLRRYKETASDVHSLRADVQSLSGILDRKVSIWTW